MKEEEEIYMQRMLFQRASQRASGGKGDGGITHAAFRAQ